MFLVYLDVEYVFYGNFESLIWFDVIGWVSLIDLVVLVGLFEEFLCMVIIFVGVVLFMWILW